MNDFPLRIETAKRGYLHLFYAGQAGFIIKSKSGQTLAVDLYLSDCGERLEGHIGFKRLLPRILNPQEIAFDYIIATHPHFDHYDVDSMPFMMSWPNTQLYASINCDKYVHETMIDESRVTYVKPSDSFNAGDYSLHFINCDHGSLAPDAVGVIIEIDGKRIIVTGDTCLRLERANEYLSKGAIDIMIAPINGAYGNLNEDDCVELCKVLNPKLTIPCHYGLFATHKGQPGVFMEIMKEKCPGQDYLLMTMGESILL